MRTSILFSTLFGMTGTALLLQAVKIKSTWPEPMGPEAYPIAVTALLVAAALYNLVTELRAAAQERRAGRRPAPPPDQPQASGGAWITPLVVATLGVAYVLGLMFLGFFVSTFLFMLSTMVALHHFERSDHLLTKTVLVYLPVCVATAGALYLGIRVLRIYVPTQTWLF